MRARDHLVRGGGRRLVLLAAFAWAAACAADAPPPDRGADDWDPQRWQAEVRSHMASVEPLLPRLGEAARAEDSPELREFLRSVQPVLEQAEQSVPGIPWRAGMAESALLQRYSASLRETRYGVGVLLDGLVRADRRRESEGRGFIARGGEGLRGALDAARGDADTTEPAPRDTVARPPDAGEGPES
jgi:hypothetical protein